MGLGIRCQLAVTAPPPPPPPPHPPPPPATPTPAKAVPPPATLPTRRLRHISQTGSHQASLPTLATPAPSFHYYTTRSSSTSPLGNHRTLGWAVGCILLLLLLPSCRCSLHLHLSQTALSPPTRRNDTTTTTPTPTLPITTTLRPRARRKTSSRNWPLKRAVSSAVSPLAFPLLITGVIDPTSVFAPSPNPILSPPRVPWLPSQQHPPPRHHHLQWRQRHRTRAGPS